MSLTKESKEYYEKTERSHRNANGQFFTEDDVKVEALKDVDIPDGSRILENSCGSGEFIKSILGVNSNVQIDGFDIEQDLVDISNKLYPSANVVCQDFLPLEHKAIYDFVIGNPPYFQIKKGGNEALLNKYSDVLSGRANIYSMFFKASIDSLKEGGQLIYVVPTSMNNGAYFKNLRKYIVDNCNIELIDLLGRDRFQNVQQSTMIIKLIKLKSGEINDGKYIFKKNGTSIFSEKYKELRQSSTEGKTLRELGFLVYTGHLVWNQQKAFMSDDSSNTVLVWASNIVDGRLEIPSEKITKDKAKGQYVSTYNTTLKISKFKLSLKPHRIPLKRNIILNIAPITEKSIVLNRITGAGANAKIRAAIVDIPSGYYTENHVNYIIKGENCEYSLEDLHEQLLKPNTMKFIQMLTGNTQISKTELEKIIPFSLDKQT